MVATLLLTAACGGDDAGGDSDTAIGDPPSTGSATDASTGHATSTGTNPTSDGATDADTAGDATGTGSDGAATLTVVVNGPGGTVTSDPPGIDCGADCDETLPSGTTITLTATTAGAFVGWGGACDGSVSQCEVTLTADTEVVANFAL
jgi:hypothetical protein